MPNFSTDLPVDREGYGLPIRRTPTHGRLTAIVTSNQMVGCDTHFFRGHTIPCERPDCEACRVGIPFRWHTYIGCLEQSHHLHIIFEATLQASLPFVEYRQAHNDLRGCGFEATRLHAQPNGRVIIRTKPAPIEHIRLPGPPDLIACLSIIWNLPREGVNVSNGIPQSELDYAKAHADTFRFPQTG